MAERNQVSGSLRCHNAGQPRGFQGISFWRSVLPHGDNCFGGYQDARGCDSSSRGDRFRARIDHADAAFFVDVSQFFQASSSRVISNHNYGFRIKAQMFSGKRTILTRALDSIIFTPSGTLIKAVARAKATKSEDPPHFKGSASKQPC